MTPYRELNKEQLQVLKAQLEKEFEEVIKTMHVNEITSTMISLQYTLSQGLVEKYRLHRLAIFLILFAAIPLMINTLIIFFV